MEKGRKTAAVILTVFLIAVQMVFAVAPVMASSYKKINSVSLHVRSKLQAGDEFNSDNLVIAEPDEGEVGVWTNSDKFYISSLKLVSGSSKDLKVGQEIRVRAVLEIFDEYGPKYAERNGGYTRIVKIGQRKGDAAMEVLLELV